MLLCRASLGQLNDTGLTALMMAASCQDLIVLQLLIRSGADVNLTSAEGKSALWFAVTASLRGGNCYIPAETDTYSMLVQRHSSYAAVKWR